MQNISVKGSEEEGQNASHEKIKKQNKTENAKVSKEKGWKFPLKDKTMLETEP